MDSKGSSASGPATSGAYNGGGGSRAEMGSPRMVWQGKYNKRPMAPEYDRFNMI